MRNRGFAEEDRAGAAPRLTRADRAGSARLATELSAEFARKLPKCSAGFLRPVTDRIDYERPDGTRYRWAKDAEGRWYHQEIEW